MKGEQLFLLAVAGMALLLDESLLARRGQRLGVANLFLALGEIFRLRRFAGKS